MASGKIIIDTDPATGYRFRDVDDGLAVLYLLALADEFDTLALTAVHGNASQPRTFDKAVELVDVAERSDVPVPRGAVNRRDLGVETAASRYPAGSRAKARLLSGSCPAGSSFRRCAAGRTIPWRPRTVRCSST